MSLLLQIIYRFTLKRITKLQKLHYPPRNSRVGNKSPVLFVKQTRCTKSPARKIFIERPEMRFHLPNERLEGLESLVLVFFMHI